MLWTLAHPLLLMLAYFFVFGVVLEARFGNDPSRSGFALYFLAGMLPWVAFSEAAGRSPLSVLDNRNVVKRMLFPVEILPVNLAVVGLVTEVFALAVFVAALIVTRGGVPLTSLWLPLIVIPQVLLTAGVCWMLGALGVFLRDLGQMMGFILTLMFFLTPICYPESKLPGVAAQLLSLSPIYQLVAAYRAVLLESQAPPAGLMAGLYAQGLAAFFLGYELFRRLRKSFADVV